jgi:hypothetical protein
MNSNGKGFDDILTAAKRETLLIHYNNLLCPLCMENYKPLGKMGVRVVEFASKVNQNNHIRKMHGEEQRALMNFLVPDKRLNKTSNFIRFVDRG